MELPPSLSRPLRRWERAVVVLDVVLGVALCALVALMIAIGVADQADPNAPHGGAFLFLGALVIGPSGPLFLLAGLAVWRQWRARWWLHALPFAPVVVVLFGLGRPGL